MTNEPVVNSLNQIESFGAVDADADELLRTCFQNHEAYKTVRSMKRFLVLGRKGSGKTAIYRQIITQRDPEVFSLGHNFDDYPWHHHDLQASQGVPEERRYIHSWKYLILIGLAKIVLNSDQSQPWSEQAHEALVSIEDFVVDSYGSRDPDFRQLFSPERKLRLKGTFRFNLADVHAERIAVRELPVHIQQINTAMQHAIMRVLNPEFKYYICFDQLDLGFSGDAAYQQRLTGLLIAARDIFISAREYGVQMNPVVFLRDDIYQDLQFEDKNKITQNYSTRVLWTESGGLTLRDLMERRFREVLPGSAGTSWADIFDEGKEMPGRQSKYKHICDRTLMRPRDMIKFCNDVLDAYKQSGRTSNRFENDVVHLARDSYSNYLLEELDDEIGKHVPPYRDFLEVLKTVGQEKFSFESYADVFASRSELAGIDPKASLADLFEFSVISYLKPGGRGGGSEYVWRYKDPRARFDGNVEAFRVHPGFKEALDLVR